jgi:hypothetical protein
MYGFPPIIYKDLNKLKPTNKQQTKRAYIDKSYVNIRQILYNRKKQQMVVPSHNNDIDIVTTL